MASANRYIELTIRLAPDGDQWAAECLELGTAACGNSLEEARAVIMDLVSLHLNALADVGACEQFLRKHGVPVHRTRPKPVGARVTVRPDEYVTRFTEPIPRVLAM